MTCNRREKGFSLLEAVIALGILSLLLIPLSSLITSGFQKINTARSLAEATSLLQSAIEEVKLQAASGDWDMIVQGEPTGYPSDDENPRYKMQITDVENGPSTDTKWVTITLLNADGSSIAGGQVETRIFLYKQ